MTTEQNPAAKLLALTGHEVTISLSETYTPLGLGLVFELLTVLLGESFDIEVKHQPKPSLTIARRR